MSGSILPCSISLVSNACLDVFGSNSRTAFNNLLHSAISKRTHKVNVWVRLHSVSISTLSRIEPQTVKIHLGEIEDQRRNDRSSKSIGAFFYPSKSSNNGYFHHNFTNSVYLPLSQSRLQSFQVSITDLADDKIDIPEGGETVVTLEVTDNNMLARDSFTISCSSFHPRIYPSNASANFSSPLYREMDLGGDYEVALQSIVYPAGLYEETRVWMKINSVEFAYQLSEFENTNDFLAEVRLDVAQSRFSSEVLFDKDRSGHHAGKVIISRTHDARNPELSEELIIEMSQEFAAVCGIVGMTFIPQTLRRGENLIFGLGDINNATPNPVAVLESNVVGSSLIGSRKANILQCVPVLSDKNKVDQSTMFIPPNLFFQPVLNRPIDSISFKFTNPDGSRRIFYCRHARHEVIITLVFRRRIVY